MTWLWLIVAGFLCEDFVSSSHEYNAVSDLYAQCFRFEAVHRVSVIAGEALRLICPNMQCRDEANSSQVFWFKNSSRGIQPISLQEESRVHQHGPVLYFLPLTLNDTGRYLTYWVDEYNCDKFETDLKVYEGFDRQQLYAPLREQSESVLMWCPVCKRETMKSNEATWFRWFKDFQVIAGEHNETLQLYHTSPQHGGIYTCECSFQHAGHVYKSNASFQLTIKEPQISFPPTFIIPTNNSVQLVDLGSEVLLNCSVFFGHNMREQCYITWERNQETLDGVEGYKSSIRELNGTFESVLTISEVSLLDVQSEFRCTAKNANVWIHAIISLKIRGSVVPLVLTFLFTTLLLLLLLALVKCFSVDLILFLRGLRFIQKKRDDGKVYDAYVIHQKDGMDEKTEEMLNEFISQVLPAVLEQSCGFKLYIHGRDDLPGEDCMELIEEKLRLSRRLLVVLTPGNRAGLTGSLRLEDVALPQSYDWQVGLHRVLVEQELGVIPIQLGDVGDVSHLPLGLQHLLHKTAPLKWDGGGRQDASPRSRFWKKVRYMMPVPPAPPRSGQLRVTAGEEWEASC